MGLPLFVRLRVKECGSLTEICCPRFDQFTLPRESRPSLERRVMESCTTSKRAKRERDSARFKLAT